MDGDVVTVCCISAAADDAGPGEDYRAGGPGFAEAEGLLAVFSGGYVGFWVEADGAEGGVEVVGFSEE